MNKIWIAKRGQYDYTLAKKFGDLQPIFDDKDSLINIAKVRERIRLMFNNEASKGDYILLAGSLLINVLLVCEWPFDDLNLLVWNVRNKRYSEKIIDLKR